MNVSEEGRLELTYNFASNLDNCPRCKRRNHLSVDRESCVTSVTPRTVQQGSMLPLIWVHINTHVTCRNCGLKTFTKRLIKTI